MATIITDMNAMKYRKVECPICKNTDAIKLEYEEKDDFGNNTLVYLCVRCDENFSLSEYDITYQEGSYDEDKWNELTYEMKLMIGI